MLKKYLVSYPVVLTAVVLTIPTMLCYYRFENWAIQSFTEPTYLHLALTFVPSVLYSIIVIVFGMVYNGVAVALTDWGNEPNNNQFGRINS